MGLRYYADTDSLYVEFKRGFGTETREASSGLNVDLDAERVVVGFDIANESKRPDLSMFEVESRPVRSCGLPPNLC